MYSSEQIKMSNWTKSYSYKLTAEQIQAVENNECWNFKTTSEGKETMKQIWKETPFGVEGGFGLKYAESYDEASWFRARCAYLEHKNYELEEQIKNNNDSDDCDEDELECWDCGTKLEDEDEWMNDSEGNIVCVDCYYAERDGWECQGAIGCGNTLKTEDECRQLMCQPCIDRWKEYERKGTPIAERWGKEEDEEEFECRGCGKSFHYKSDKIKVEEFYLPDDDYRVDVTCSDCQGKYCPKCDVSMENEGGCDCQIIKCGECGLEGPKYNHNRGDDDVLRCDDCHSD